MKKLLILGLSGLLLVGGATLGHAQDPNGGHHDGEEIKAMIHDQNLRIDEARKHGDLTHEEAERLHGKEEEVRAKLEDFKQKNGGFLTNNEQENLMQSMHEIGGEIHREKHSADAPRQ